jgi:DNA-binding beta-propeller fold protein YncE
MRLASIAILLLAGAAWSPTSAVADGLPLPVDDVGPSGVVSPDGASRYVTIESGGDTLVERIDTAGGEVAQSVRLKGPYTIPAAALDATPGGLSTDGSTLILISPRVSFPRETTDFVRIETDHFTNPHPFTLDGDFSFDALSPDGQRMYLINYTSPHDPTEYHVRAFDLASERLLPGTVSDPDEEDDEMYGYALSRTTSPDGRWAYTLYMGPNHPFIHALDTERGAADCIDLDELDPRSLDLYGMRLRTGAGGSYLVISNRKTPLLTVDPRTHTVGKIPTDALASAVSRGEASPSRPSSAGPWIGVGAVGVGLALAALVGVIAVRRRSPGALAS